MAKPGYVYILASRRNGTLYVGVTGRLKERIWQHKHEEREGFTKRYGVHRLVHRRDDVSWGWEVEINAACFECNDAWDGHKGRPCS